MASTVELERLLVRLVGDSSQFRLMMQQAMGEVRGFERHLDRMSTVVLARFGMELTRLGTNVVKTFSDFDKAMVEATSIMGDNVDITGDMRKAALELSTKGKFGPTELAKAYYELASAGMSAESAIAALPAVQNFAIAGNFNLSKATELSITTLNALGRSTGDPALNLQRLTDVMDTLTYANNIAIGTTETFARAMTRGAAASMNMFGISLEEGVALLSIFAKKNIQAEYAGNAFQRLLLLMTNASYRNAEAFQYYGFSVFDATGKLKSFADIFENMHDITKNMSAEGKNKFLGDIGFEARIRGAVLPLLSSAKDIRAELAKFSRENIANSTAKVAERQMQAFANQVAQLYNQFQVLTIQGFSQVAPFFVELIKLVQGMMMYLIGLSDGTKRWGMSLLIAASALGTLLLSLRILRFLMPGIIRQFVGLVNILRMLGGAAIFSPLIRGIGLVTGSLFGLIALLIGKIPIIGGFLMLGAVAFKFIAIGAAALLAFVVPLMVGLTVISAVIAVIGIGVAGWVTKMGGLEATWKAIKAHVAATWEWLKPARYAMESLLQAIGEMVTLLGALAFGAIEQVWKNLFGSNIDWEATLDQITKFILLLEYAIRNAKKTWDLFQVAAQYGIIAIGNRFEFLMITTIPEIMSWLGERFVDIFIIAVNALYDIIKQVVPDLPWKNMLIGFGVALMWHVLQAMIFLGSAMNRITDFAQGKTNLAKEIAKARLDLEKEAEDDGKLWKDAAGKMAQISKNVGTQISRLTGPNLTPYMESLAEGDARRKMEQMINEYMAEAMPWILRKQSDLKKKQLLDEEKLKLDEKQKARLVDDFQELGGTAGAEFSKSLHKHMDIGGAILADSAEWVQAMQDYAAKVSDPLADLYRNQQEYLRNVENIEAMDRVSKLFGNAEKDLGVQWWWNLPLVPSGGAGGGGQRQEAQQDKMVNLLENINDSLNRIAQGGGVLFPLSDIAK